jgi:ABC-type Fe3+-siderophore transport system permease subunit
MVRCCWCAAWPPGPAPRAGWLTLGEATAASLGLPLAPLRYGLVAVLALATGTSVAQTGLIAFVGLAAPHLVRSLVRGPCPQHLLAAAMGACCCWRPTCWRAG